MGLRGSRRLWISLWLGFGLRLNQWLRFNFRLRLRLWCWLRLRLNQWFS